jgi:hypothetical protein
MNLFSRFLELAPTDFYPKQCHTHPPRPDKPIEANLQRINHSANKRQEAKAQ